MLRLLPDDPLGEWTAAGVYEVGDELYRIPLPLPTDALRAVNVYAVRDGEGLVLVDSGWALAQARDILEQAVNLLGHGLADIRRFLVTHVHRDHYTMAVAVRREFGTRVSLGHEEAGTLRLARETAPNTGLVQQLGRGGAPELARELRASPAPHDPASWEDADDWIDAPTDIALQKVTWQAYPTPGHTRGHVVFVDAERDVMFAGDHVLPRITPSIGFENNVAELPLGAYLDSLRLVRTLPDRRLLPAHGPVSPSVHARVDELLEHHDTRLSRIADSVTAHPGTAAETARRLRWTRRGRRFEELDLISRCLAVTETMAHLDVLVAAGRLRRTDEDGASHYALLRVPRPSTSARSWRNEMSGVLAESLKEWQPGTAEMRRRVDPWPAAAFAGLTGVPLPGLEQGDPLPPLWHWFTLIDHPAQSAIGPDGHPADGPFLPPIPGRRRMFAGGRLRMDAPIPVGADLSSRSSVAGVTVKAGRSGELAFVTVRHQLAVDGTAVGVEEQDLVYRSEPGDAAPRATRRQVGLPDPAGEWRRELTTGPVLLFRFSALTYNSHRIHYDRLYATQVEGYPDLVVHGPLLALLALELPRAHAPGMPVKSFEYRLARPAFASDRIVAAARPDGTTVEVDVGATGGGSSLTGRIVLGSLEGKRNEHTER